ncbi:MAG: enoyl-CoA hydratase-related protein, partial [Pseudomonadota bacterium]
MTIFHYDVDADGIATLTWDLPGKSMNVMTLEGLAELNDGLDKSIADEAVKGIVITSAKKDFAGGMDLNILAKMKEDAGDAPAQGLFDGTMRMHQLLRKIERNTMDPKTNKGGKPVAWACPGTAAGIGLEIGLACH